MPETVSGIAFREDSTTRSQELFVRGFKLQIFVNGTESSGDFFAYSASAQFLLPGMLRQVQGEFVRDWLLTDDPSHSIGFAQDRLIEDVQSHFRGERPTQHERLTQAGRDMTKLIYDAVASGDKTSSVVAGYDYKAVPVAELAVDLAGTPPSISL